MRNIPVSKINDELRKSNEEGIINDEQLSILEGRFYEIAGKGKTNIIDVIGILGAVLTGLGIILFVASNWFRINNNARFAGITCLMILSYVSGYILAFKKEAYPVAGRVLIFLGTLIFGGDLFLINNIYNMNISDYNIFLLWGIGILPVCFTSGETLTSWLFSSLGILWNLLSLSDVTSFNLWYILYAAAGLYLAKKKDSGVLRILSIIGAAMFYFTGIAAAQNEHPSFTMPMFFALLGVIIYGASTKYDAKENYRGIYRISFVLLILFSFYLMTFEEFNRSLSMSADIKFIITASVTILGAFYMFITAKDKTWELKAAVILPVYYSLLNYIPFAYNYKVIINNITFPVFTILALIYGYKRGRNYIFSAALGFFILEIITRYFDYFFKVLPRSMFFIIGGIILLTGGIILERNRRKNSRGDGRDI